MRVLIAFLRLPDGRSILELRTSERRLSRVLVSSQRRQFLPFGKVNSSPDLLESSRSSFKYINSSFYKFIGFRSGKIVARKCPLLLALEEMQATQLFGVDE